MRFLLTSILLFSSFVTHAEINLKDLGLNSAEVEVSPAQLEMQKTMETRHRMLKTHEILGLTTLGLMTATFLTGDEGADSDTHMYLGMATGVMYFTTAYYSLSAPKPEGIKDRGTIKWHKRLAWIHFPAMVLAPILGYMYKQNENRGKESTGIVAMHPTIATAAFASFALSAALMTFEF
ncbi:MAG: hypothetical protein K2P81_07915 [Bacteriovoracaceae bacterium]|nr:hypothetical protein [Bacteriovoracaceae bacterium]